MIFTIFSFFFFLLWGFGVWVVFLFFMVAGIELRASHMLGKHPITEPYSQPPTLIPNVLTVRFLNPTCRPHWTTTVCPWPLGTEGHCKLLLRAGSLVHLYVAGWRGILCQNPWLPALPGWGCIRVLLILCFRVWEPWPPDFLSESS